MPVGFDGHRPSFRRKSAIEAAKRDQLHTFGYVHRRRARHRLHNHRRANLGMTEVSEAAKSSPLPPMPKPRLFFGAIIDEKLKDEIKVTVVAPDLTAKRTISQ